MRRFEHSIPMIPLARGEGSKSSRNLIKEEDFTTSGT